MNDDSAEWMAQLKASGQLRPANEGERGDGDGRMGVVTNTNDEGRQVLGTCSPEPSRCRSLPSQAELAEWLREIFSADVEGTTWDVAAEELLLLLTGEIS